MGFQTFTCVICGESITRRNSKRFGEGRACNKHEEVVEDLKSKAQLRTQSVLKDALKEYKINIGKKHPVKDKLQVWLEEHYVRFLLTTKDEFKRSDENLTILKEAGYITLQYQTTEQFVDAMMNIIKEHENDDDWETIRKEAKTGPKSEKAKRIERKVRDKKDEDHNYRVKEHRGAKEAPRRKPSPKGK